MQSEPGSVGPRGTVTFLFTDIEGSTRLLQEVGEAYGALLGDHRSLTLGVLERHGGHFVDSAGDGLFVVFERARDALVATLEAQRALAAHAWPNGVTVRVRMGLHTGEPVVASSGYIGLDVNRAARIAAAAHGGQVVLSESTRQLVAEELPPGVTLLDLGEHRLKDMPRLERLYQVRATGLAATFPPLRTAGRASTVHLPPRTQQLVGRDDELAAIRELLLRDDVRLLSLTGTGGTGKTTLAVEAATRCIDEFPDGVAYVALAPLVDPALLFAAIAQTLGVAAGGEQRVIDAVIDHLCNRRMLLVLDNFEHLVAGAADLAMLVAACPNIKLLVTSRFALRLSMEREFPVPPLRTPDPATASNAALLRSYPAVELFARRAAAVKPGFRLDGDSTVAVAEICHRLDGLPLAIELAAARIKLFTPRALLARLDRRLELLSGGARDLPDRHRTLRHAIGWSYDLLEPGEQAVFRRIAVFAGGCTLDSAESVCAAAGPPALPAFEGVAALVDKSLLRLQSANDDEPRFIMLETVREFALEQLAASGEEAATRAAHADVFIALAEAAAPELRGEGQKKWLPRLEREHGDMRAAFDWTIRTRDASRALRLGAALCRFWIIRGFHTEGRERLRAALALPYTPEDEPARARVLSGAAVLAYEQSDLTDADRQLKEALDIFRAAGDDRGIAETLNHIGWARFFAGDVESAQSLSEQALAIHEASGDRNGIALSLTNLGGIALQTGDPMRAQALYERALALRRQGGDPRSIAYGSLNLGWALSRLGQFERADALARDAERTLRELGDSQILAFAVFIRGESALYRRDLEQALRLLEESVELSREIPRHSTLGIALSRFSEALASLGEFDRALDLVQEGVAMHQHTGTFIWQMLCLGSQGDVLRMAGRFEESRESFLRALRIAAPRRMRLYTADAFEGLADLDATAGRFEAALRKATAALSLRAAAGTFVTRSGIDLEKIIAEASAQLDSGVAAEARAEGQAIDMDRLDSIAAVLREDGI